LEGGRGPGKSSLFGGLSPCFGISSEKPALFGRVTLVPLTYLAILHGCCSQKKAASLERPKREWCGFGGGGGGAGGAGGAGGSAGPVSLAA